ncbi:FUSC family protein [Paenibacillus aceti]|uniref:UPF0421 protein YgaE n=1 Tax=Paenibacillus aceti TaxID=1820010 RepID=A0ABQ1W2R5_9BACL|nr:aromatic acid exporter family protein [Paenibacillus aceti]GGG12045.1 UPF0421 protein YgaE [Paenibacillus aceti]
MTFGARMLKTGLAVTLALYVVMWLDLSPPLMAGIAAIFAMQPSIYRSWRYLIDQLQTNVLGAVLAMLGGMLFSNAPIAVGLVCIIVIMICLKLKMGETIGVTLVTVISVMEASGQWAFALNRLSLSLIGILSAFIINIIIFPPKPQVQYEDQVKKTFGQLSLLLRTAVSDEMKETVSHQEKRSLEDAINSLSEKYKLMEEDQKRLRTPKFSESRQLVIYKQMLKTLHKGYEALDAIEQHYFQAVRSPELNQEFDTHLERMIKFHEHIMLKFENKLKPNVLEAQRFEEQNDRFLATMLEHYADHTDGTLRLSIVSAEIYEYGYQLQRLNRLAEHSPSLESKEEDK